MQNNTVSELSEELIRLLEVLEDNVELLPEYQCMNCGSTDCDAESHPELDGCPVEEWCNVCENKSIYRVRASSFQMLIDVKSLFNQAIATATQQAVESEQKRIIGLEDTVVEATLDSLNGCGIDPGSHSYKLVENWLHSSFFFLDCAISKPVETLSKKGTE